MGRIVGDPEHIGRPTYGVVLVGGACTRSLHWQYQREGFVAKPIFAGLSKWSRIPVGDQHNLPAVLKYSSERVCKIN